MPPPRLDSGIADSIVVWGAIAGIIGSRIYDVFDNWSSTWGTLRSIVFSGAGFVWYGGLIGGSFRPGWSRAITRSRSDDHGHVRRAVDARQAFGRMGCQLSGDGDWGVPSTLPWAMAYPKAIVGWHGDLHLADGGFIPATVLKLNQRASWLTASSLACGSIRHRSTRRFSTSRSSDSLGDALAREVRRRTALSLPDPRRRSAIPGRVRQDQPTRDLGFERGPIDFHSDDRRRRDRMGVAVPASADARGARRVDRLKYGSR